MVITFGLATKILPFGTLLGPTLASLLVKWRFVDVHDLDLCIKDVIQYGIDGILILCILRFLLILLTILISFTFAFILVFWIVTLGLEI